MILPIYTYGNKVLRQKCTQVNLSDPGLPKTVSDMYETMYDAGGIGLAAPQVGISQRIIVIDANFPKEESLKGVFLNANVLAYFGFLYETIEGCLSFPGITDVKVMRPFGIRAEWYDKDKRYHNETLQGIKASILLHEIEHTDGILFIDRTLPGEAKQLREKLKVFQPVKT